MTTTVDKKCMRFIISGIVQGVWFRAATKNQAQKLSLTGWVRNLPSGQVEVIACGKINKLDILHQWLHKGPILAKVSAVNAQEIAWQHYDDFTIC